jgi:hypothetical protein
VVWFSCCLVAGRLDFVRLSIFGFHFNTYIEERLKIRGRKAHYFMKMYGLQVVDNFGTKIIYSSTRSPPTSLPSSKEQNEREVLIDVHHSTVYEGTRLASLYQP